MSEAAAQYLVADPKAVKQSLSEVILAKNIHEMLARHYPEHMWAVNVDGENGVANIFNLSLSGRWGFVLHIAKIDNDYKVVMRAGGELLERYRLRRGRFNPDDLSLTQKDFSGNYMADK